MNTVEHTQRLLNSYTKWLGRELLPRSGDPEIDRQALFAAPFIVVSHGTQPDPILNYGNRAALDLWETTWDQLTQMPSRLTAEPMHRDERAQFMARVKTEGHVRGYRGVRISSSGKRFMIDAAIIWNVLDEQGGLVGQAATFETWRAVS
jgi:hypothetical protein